jgi:antimicrobial peptide system SdpB family protein
MQMRSFNQKLEQLTIHKFPYTNVVGLGRSLLALGTLITLLFNPLSLLRYENTKLETLSNFWPLKLNFFTLLGFDNIFYMKILAIIILLLTISGYFIKITAVLHWWISLSYFYFCSGDIIEGGDKIATNITLLLLPILLTDRRKNHWHTIDSYAASTTIFALFSVWAIRLQVAIIYFHSTVSKFFVEPWANGTEIYYLFNHTIYGLPNFLIPLANNLLINPIVVSTVTYSALILEILLVLGLTASIRYRKTVLFLGLLFHFSILCLMGLFSFFFFISAALILFLYPTYKTIPLQFSFLKKSINE